MTTTADRILQDEETVIREVTVRTEKELLFELVGTEWRTMPLTRYLTDKVTQALLKNETLKISGTYSLDRYVRWAKANGLTLHRKTFPEFVIVWATDKEASNGNKG